MNCILPCPFLFDAVARGESANKSPPFPPPNRKESIFKLIHYSIAEHQEISKPAGVAHVHFPSLPYTLINPSLLPCCASSTFGVPDYTGQLWNRVQHDKIAEDELKSKAVII